MSVIVIRTCSACGTADYAWTSEHRPGKEVWLYQLAANQCVGSAYPEDGHILYTHDCKPEGGAR